MKKIRMKLEAIEVESFPTELPVDAKGTVEGFAASRAGDTWCITCGEDTCDCTNWYCTQGIC